MAQLYLVVDELSAWAPNFPSDNLIDFATYLNQVATKSPSRTRVINLCKNNKYLSNGYYCSLLAEAREQHVIPSVATLNNLRNKVMVGVAVNAESEVLSALVIGDKQVIKVKSYFGHSAIPELAALCRDLFELVPCPILELTFKKRRH